jgi:hypothetical protein
MLKRKQCNSTNSAVPFLLADHRGYRKERKIILRDIKAAIFSQHMKDALEEENILSAVYFGFQSTYDLIWKENLLFKLTKIGIRTILSNWFEEFTVQRFCKVR